MSSPLPCWCVSACVLTLLVCPVVRAQDLEPRAYSASPVGTSFLVAGIGRSTGDVVTDPTLPVEDVRASIQAITVGVGQTFSLAGRLAQATVVLPYSWGRVDGKIQEQAQFITRSGLADMRMRIALNLWGAPAMSLAEFAKRQRHTLIGVSLTMSAPVGQYDPHKLINLGTDRWGLKPEIGISYPFRHWDLDAYAGAWFFTDNPNFYPGDALRSQNPIGVMQIHASYTFKRRGWVAADGTWYGGGSARVDDQPPTGRQNNARYGATLVWPVGRRQSIKAAYATGAFVRSGANFRTVLIAWQILWIKAARP